MSNYDEWKEKQIALDAREELAMDVAWALPKEVAYWAAIRLGCYASQGKWGNESPTDMLMVTVLKRWDKHEEPETAEKTDEPIGMESTSGLSQASE
jgi:hypothetical protein